MTRVKCGLKIQTLWNGFWRIKGKEKEETWNKYVKVRGNERMIKEGREVGIEE